MNLKNCYRITMAAIAITGATVLSSCSHDDYYYNEEKAEQSVNEQYAIAFEKAFGKVGPNVDWGFSSKNTNTRAFTRAGGVTFTTNLVFPGSCADSEFKDVVPTGVEKLPVTGGGALTPWYIDGNTESVSTWNTGGTLYVTGYVDLSNSNFDINPDWQIYLVEGSTLILSDASAENLKGEYYIAKDATLKTSGLLKLNSGAKVYTHQEGTLLVGSLEVNSTSLLYNKGTVTATGTVSAESNESRIVNDGNIECADVVVNAGAVKNIVEWKVSGTTHINSNNSGWINNGQWTTKDYAYLGGSENVINNCLLTVTNDFEMNISSKQGAFKINSDGGVLTTNFYGGRDTSSGAISGPFKIMMAQNSVFKVEETAILESGRSSFPNLDKYEFGFFGPDEGYAVFQAKKIIREESIKNTWGAVTYGGNLYVSAEQHFAQGNDGMEAHNFIIVEAPFTLKNIYAPGDDFSRGKPNINIRETPCNPGFSGDDPNPTYRVIAEDLSATEAGDFDFNDVVFDVEPNEAGTAAKIVVRAAGGIYKLTVAGKEVHEAFGQNVKADGLYPMINTQPWNPEVKATLFESYLGDFSSDAAIRTTIKDIVIKVYKPGFEENGIELTATKGKAACKILVDNTFTVVAERQNIADENKLFTNYVQGSFEDDFWWK